jgi:hypothetical protein
MTATQMAQIVDGSATEDVRGRSWVGGLRAQLRAATAAGDAFAIVLILAGTNDLVQVVGKAKSAHDVVAAIETLHDVARECGSVSVALTIPEMAIERSSRAIGDVRRQVKEASWLFASASESKAWWMSRLVCRRPTSPCGTMGST